MTETEKFSCTKCDRTDLTLTKNGRLRSHAADGKKAGPDNPHCPGGSDWPVGHEDAPVAPVTASGGPNPYRAPLPTSQPVTPPSEAPHTHNYKWADDGTGLTGSYCLVCGRAHPGEDVVPAHEEVEEEGVDMEEPPAPHIHRFMWADDENGHDGSFCSICGMEEPDDPNSLGTPASEPVSEADAFLGTDREEEDEGENRKGPWIVAGYDGTCACGVALFSGDNIRADGDGGWEAQECCGDDDSPEDPHAVVKPRSLQLPVRNGRYKYPHPETGKATSGTRVTTFIKAASDSIALDQWKERMTVLGLAVRPDLQKKIAARLTSGRAPYEVAKIDRDYLNGVVEQAKDAAGAKDRARKGTILHKHTEEIDAGRRTPGEVPEEFRQSVIAYVQAMDDAGLRLLPYLIERSTAITEFGGVAGTFDRVAVAERELSVTFKRKKTTQTVVIHPGDFVVVDVKTGSDLSYNWLEIIIQEAIYAHGVNENGVAASDGGIPAKWRWATTAELGIGHVREDIGIVAHMPYGGSTCTIWGLDIDTGWRGATLCGAIKDWRRMTGETVAGSILEAMAPELPAAPAPNRAKEIEGRAFQKTTPAALPASPVTATDASTGESWESLFQLPHTKDSASSLWRRAKAAGVGSRELARLSALVVLQPPTLTERASKVTTSEEANALWKEARDNMQKIGGPAKLNELVGIMKTALAGAGQTG